MDAVTTHHFSGLGAPFVRSKGTVSGGVFTFCLKSKFVNGLETQSTLDLMRLFILQIYNLKRYKNFWIVRLTDSIAS